MFFYLSQGGSIELPIFSLYFIYYVFLKAQETCVNEKMKITVELISLKGKKLSPIFYLKGKILVLIRKRDKNYES